MRRLVSLRAPSSFRFAPPVVAARSNLKSKPSPVPRRSSSRVASSSSRRAHRALDRVLRSREVPHVPRHRARRPTPRDRTATDTHIRYHRDRPRRPEHRAPDGTVYARRHAPRRRPERPALADPCANSVELRQPRFNTPDAQSKLSSLLVKRSNESPNRTTPHTRCTCSSLRVCV